MAQMTTDEFIAKRAKIDLAYEHAKEGTPEHKEYIDNLLTLYAEYGDVNTDQDAEDLSEQ